MARGRKKRDGVRRKYDVRLYLWEGEDDDLISFLESLPSRKRPAGIKLALRSGSALNLQSATFKEDDDEVDFDLNDFIS